MIIHGLGDSFCRDGRWAPCQMNVLWKDFDWQRRNKMTAPNLTLCNNYLLTYSIQHSPSWEADWFSASQEIPRILWNQKVHYRSHKCPPSLPILSQLEPVHATTCHFLKVPLNIILPSTPRSPKRSLSLRFPHQYAAYAPLLPHTRYMPRPYLSSRFYHQNKSYIIIIIIIIIMTA